MHRSIVALVIPALLALSCSTSSKDDGPSKAVSREVAPATTTAPAPAPAATATPTIVAAAHDHGSGPHGGMVVDAGSSHHLELVRTESSLDLHVLDSTATPMSVDGMSATLTVQPATGPVTVVAMSIEGERFTAPGALAPGASAIVLASVKVSGSTIVGRFVVDGAAQGHEH